MLIFLKYLCKPELIIPRDKLFVLEYENHVNGKECTVFSQAREYLGTFDDFKKTSYVSHSKTWT